MENKMEQTREDRTADTLVSTQTKMEKRSEDRMTEEGTPKKAKQEQEGMTNKAEVDRKDSESDTAATEEKSNDDKKRSVETTAKQWKVVASSEAQSSGMKRTQEDRSRILTDANIAGVFDGHGGSGISEFLQIFLLPEIEKRLQDDHGAGIEEVMKAAIAEIDKQALQIERFTFEGSTAVVVKLHEGKWVTANVGDCRAVLSREGKAVDLSNDHKPNAPTERERIEKAGGKVVAEGKMDKNGDPVPGYGIYRVNGGIGVARTLGYEFDRPALSPEPEIMSIDVDEGDEFVLLASDGVWDVMTSQEAVDVVHKAMEENTAKKEIAQLVVNQALAQKAFDNLTVAIMWIGHAEAAGSASA